VNYVVDTLVGLASFVAVLDYFGIKPKKFSEWRFMPLDRRWKLGMMLTLVAAALGMSGYNLYRSFQPKIVERIVEKTTSISVPCVEAPKDKSPEKLPEKTKSPNRSANSQQSEHGANNTNTQIGTVQAPIAIAPNGIANAAPNWGTQTVINGPPAAHFTYHEDPVISSDGGMKILKVHISTDRTVPAAHIGLLFSGPIEIVRPGSPYEPKLDGAAITQFNWGGINKNGVPIDYGMSIQINMPAAFTPGQDLIATVKSKTEVHVTDVGQLAN